MRWSHSSLFICSAALLLACGGRAALSDFQDGEFSEGELEGSDADNSGRPLLPVNGDAMTDGQGGGKVTVPAPTPPTTRTPTPSRPERPVPMLPPIDVDPEVPVMEPIPQPTPVPAPAPTPSTMSCLERITSLEAIALAQRSIPGLEAVGPLRDDLPAGQAGVVVNPPGFEGFDVIVFQTVRGKNALYYYVSYTPDCEPVLVDLYAMELSASGCWQGEGPPPFALPAPGECLIQGDTAALYSAAYKTDCAGGSGGDYQAYVEVRWEGGQGTLTLAKTPNPRLNELPIPVTSGGPPLRADYEEAARQGECRVRRTVQVILDVEKDLLEVTERLVSQCSGGAPTDCTWNSFASGVDWLLK